MAENISKNPPKGKIKFDIVLSDEQKSTKTAVLYHPYNFIMGKAGSGKTLLAVQIALDMFFTRKINQIVITRPTVSNEDNGYLPGSLDEKMEPWLVPIRSNMRKVYNKPDILAKMEKEEKIELYIPPGPRLGTNVIEANGVSKSFGDNLLYEDLSFK